MNFFGPNLLIIKITQSNKKKSLKEHDPNPYKKLKPDFQEISPEPCQDKETKPEPDLYIEKRLNPDTCPQH